MGYGGIADEEIGDVGLFAPPAFLITFRETLEAAIIVAVLIGILNKTGKPELKKYVWIGVISASMMSIALAIIILLLINIAKDELFTDENILLIEGIISVIAAFLIGVVAVTVGNVMALHDKFERQFNDEIGSDEERQNEKTEVLTKESILFLSFTSVAREGIETIIFFAGIGAAYPAESLPIPGAVGAIAGALCGIALYKFGGQMTLIWFFRFTMVLLIFIGAGVWTNGMHGLQEYGTFGTWEPTVDRPPLNREVWNIEECCGFDKSEFWVMMRVLFGYTPYPTGLEIIMYLTYHCLVIVMLVTKMKSTARKERGLPGYKEEFKNFIMGLLGKDVEPKTSLVSS